MLLSPTRSQHERLVSTQTERMTDAGRYDQTHRECLAGPVAICWAIKGLFLGDRAPVCLGICLGWLALIQNGSGRGGDDDTPNGRGIVVDGVQKIDRAVDSYKQS